MQEQEQYVTLREAARRKGVAYKLLLKYVQRGDIPSIRFGWQHSIRVADLDRIEVNPDAAVGKSKIQFRPDGVTIERSGEET